MRKLLILLTIALVAGCAPVLSKQTMQSVDRNIQLRDVAKDPSAYIGKSAVFAGSILSVETLENKTIIEVLQEGTNSQLKPVDKGSSQGRFLAVYDGFKDPAIYSQGKGLTVAGEIKGTETRKLGQGKYSYPVIKPFEDYLWEPSYGYGGGSNIGIGIGLGYTHIN